MYEVTTFTLRNKKLNFYFSRLPCSLRAAEGPDAALDLLIPFLSFSLPSRVLPYRYGKPMRSVLGS
jgi:hypothetical protein